MSSFNKKAVWIAVAVSLAGCGSLPAQTEKARSIADDTVKAVATQAPSFGLKQIESPADLPGGLVERSSQNSGRGDITLTANGPLASIVSGITEGYSVSYVSDVDRDKLVSVSLKNVNTETAVRQIARNAGYVAVIDGKTITITAEATYTFRVPARLLNAQNASYNVGGNPLSSGGSGSGGMPGMSSGSGSSVTATFTATGKSAAGGDVTAHIKAIAGTKANVSVSDTGYITVRTNGVALERIRKFLNEYVYDGNRRADVSMSVIEVTLGEEFAYGIDWSKTLASVGSTKKIALSGGAATVLNPVLGISYTTASISSIINALKSHTNVKVLTQPNITAMNRVPSLIFDGTSIPYIGQIASTSQQTSTTATAAASFATDGVSLSLLADIMSDHEAQIALLPVITGVKEFKTFNLGALGQIVAPTSVEKHALMTANVENGQTVILGGIRISKESDTKSKVPFTEVPVGGDSTGNAKELVILLQSNVVSPKAVETLVTESL